MDLLHPLATVHFERCLNFEDGIYYNVQCAVLNDKVAVLTVANDDVCDTLHVTSMDLQSWTTTKLPYHGMPITSYKSQFVTVGGWDVNIRQYTNLVWTSDTGLVWQPSLPCLHTRRCDVSLISSSSPEVLVCAGGRSSGGYVTTVELLIKDSWSSSYAWSYACPLPIPCSFITATLHCDEIVFSLRKYYCICNIAKLISSCSYSAFALSPSTMYYTARTSVLEELSQNFMGTLFSYHSRLFSVVGHEIFAFFRVTKSWVNITCVGEKATSSNDTAITTLPNGDMIMANERDGVYRLKVSGE